MIMYDNVIVCGGRTYGDKQKIRDCLLSRLKEDDIVWQGGANGADRIALKEATQLGYNTVTVHANWVKYNTAAGPIRNKLMLDLAMPCRLVIAFPGGPGTAHMVKIAKAARVEVIEVQ